MIIRKQNNLVTEKYVLVTYGFEFCMTDFPHSTNFYRNPLDEAFI